MTTEITTNHHMRSLQAFYELPAKAQKQFDYMGEPNVLNDEHYYLRFFKYRDYWYDTNEFQRATSDDLKEWDGFAADTYFSATLVKYAEDYERVIVGRAYWS
jgi:hypothetical protein